MSTHQDLPPVTAASIRAAIVACNEERRRITEATGVEVPLVPLPAEDEPEGEGR